MPTCPGRVAERYAGAGSSRSRPATSTRSCRSTRGGARRGRPARPGRRVRIAAWRASASSSISRRSPGTPVAIFRLNYAVDLRYGVLVDLGQRGLRGRADRPDDGLRQRDLAGRRQRVALRCLTTPPRRRGPQRDRAGDAIGVRWLAEQFGGALRQRADLRGRGGRRPPCSATPPRPSASSATPRRRSTRMIAWTADWLGAAGRRYDKPTHFEAREGRF